MKKILPVLFFVFVCMLTICFLGRAAPSFGADVSENDGVYKAMPLNRSLFLRQSYNNCAPYSAMAVISILRKNSVDPEILAEQTAWRIQKNLTMPQGLLKLLHDYDIHTKEFTMFLYSDKEKINWLKNMCDNNTPVILLIREEDFLHYITLLGYDSHGFLFYDSMQKRRGENSEMTVTDRVEYEGNRYYSFEEAVAMWNKGNVGRFFKNWAVVCS